MKPQAYLWGLLLFGSLLTIGAQDSGGADFNEGFGEGFGEGFEEGFGSGDDGGFGGGFGEGSLSGESPVTIGGTLTLPLRYYSADPDEDQALEASPEGEVELRYESGKADGLLAFAVTPEGARLEELSLRYAGRPFLLEAGYRKKVWGKGDEFHVTNLMNPRDLRDFSNPEHYVDRIAPELILSLSLPLRLMGQLELLYAPRFTGDLIPSEGRWTPYQAQDSAALAQAALQYQAMAAYNSTLAATGGDTAAASLAQAQYLSEHGDASALSPDTSGWDHHQWALSYTDTFGPLDLGFLYYYGYYGRPAAVPSYEGAQVSGLELKYNRLQVFALDFAAVIGPLNTRGEAAYYLTGDRKGDDREVYNNRIKWVAGFDIGLPLSALNLNVQEAGEYILGKGKIDAQDMEYDADGDYSENLLILKLTDRYNHEKVEAGVSGVYHIEKKGWALNPSLEVEMSDNLSFRAEYRLFEGKKRSLIGQFDRNDFARAELTYSF